MAMEEKLTQTAATRRPRESTESSNSKAKKLEVFNEVLRRLQESHHPDAQDPAFAHHLSAHFNRLPPRYAIDVNSERAHDVLTHKKLLHLARDPANRPAFHVRLVQIMPVSEGNLEEDSVHSCSPSIHPPPAFGSSPNLEALALEENESIVQGEYNGVNAGTKFRPMHEITFSTADKPKLLNQLTSLLAEVGLNIQEAHVFSTVDGYSLAVFVVDGWPLEEIEQLRSAIEKEVMKTEKRTWSNQCSLPSLHEQDQIRIQSEPNHLRIPNDGTDVWEIDTQFLKFELKVASGSYGDLYKGTYCSQEVAIKILKAERLNTELQREFAQEVYIMRKIRHKNVVQFIGACTRPPNLCIVTEYMSGGSVYDYLHKLNGTFKLPALLKVAIDVSKGMTYLHQNNIVHRDLKTANLLMDENEVVKVGDFGVARVKAQSGVMTAETGTYRWMAPEVIEHKPYDQKADVFSYGVVIWELLTGKLPYEKLSPVQAAVGVVQKGLRPTIPQNTHKGLAELLERCWQRDPTLRPDFGEITEALRRISKEMAAGGGGDDDGVGRGQRRKQKTGGLFSSLRRTNTAAAAGGRGGHRDVITNSD